MSKRHLKSDSRLSGQGRLFESGVEDGGLDVRMTFRDTLTSALRKCPQSRWHIAAEVSRLSAHDLSKDILDKCTSSNFDYGLRAEDLPALCHALGDIEPMRVLMQAIGCDAVTPEEGDLVRLARLERKNSDLQGEIAALRARLGIRK